MPDEDSDWDKLLTQHRLLIGALLKPLRTYGQGEYVDGVLEELVQAAVQFHYKLEGIDMPYNVNTNLHW